MSESPDADAGVGGGPTGRLGHFRARDGSRGASVAVDFERPHAACVVGKRGSGKSHTLAVLAEGLATAPGVTPLVCDPMGAFAGLEAGGFRVRAPRVRANALPPRAWPSVLELDPAGGPGALVWRAATECETLAEMGRFVEASDAPASTRRAATNHLSLADSWGVFDAEAPDVEGMLTTPTVVSLAGVPAAPANAVVRVLAAACYRARVADRVDRLPWLLVDEAHAFFDGVARPALGRLLTRGRAPGVSLTLATQRPAALPEVAISQSDLLFAHRLTAPADRAALRDARPAGGEALDRRWPTERGTALVFDDATDRVVSVRVRERRTPDGSESPRASEFGDEASPDHAEPTRTGHPGLSDGT